MRWMFELDTFFQIMFGIDVTGDLNGVEFPTFEEVLGLTDLAVLRKDSFRGFELENRATNSGRLRFLNQHLIFLVALIIDERLREKAVHHKKLVRNLLQHGLVPGTCFISTNYDIMIDNALMEFWKHFDIDYGVQFRNFDARDWHRPDPARSVHLFKPHGSLNWLMCSTCGELDLTPGTKGVVTHLIQAFEQKGWCPACQTVYQPLIVPPTFYKDFNNCFLSTVWNRTDIALHKVRHIVFCGYSFPDADLHIKYLLKRAQTLRQGDLRFTVVNHYDGKADADANSERKRFERFLGKGFVRYERFSFEDFADDPLAILKPD